MLGTPENAPCCRICGADTRAAGSKAGVRIDRQFALRRCIQCGFAFVAEPWTDYSAIYDEAYYEGRGSDPLIDFAFEFENPDRTVRRHEWRGWDLLVHEDHPGPVDWLDFGCGCGTLVRYVNGLGRDRVWGFDTGVWAERARAAGVPILTEGELKTREGQFDVITAVDVLEHIPEPVGVLKQLRRLMKTGGRLYPITQNAETAPRDIRRWSYVQPEIHVSFFTPRSMAAALQQSGFEPAPLPTGEGWRDILRCRILKNLRIKKINSFEKLLPWGLLTGLAERKVRMGAMPIGIAV